MPLREHFAFGGNDLVHVALVPGGKATGSGRGNFTSGNAWKVS